MCAKETPGVPKFQELQGAFGRLGTGIRAGQAVRRDRPHDLRLEKGHQQVRAQQARDVPAAAAGNQKPVGVSVTIRIERLRARDTFWNRSRKASFPRIS